MVVEPPVPSVQPKRGLRILLAEDDDAMRNVIQQVLTRAGHTVVALEDGFELADYVELIRQGGGLDAPHLHPLGRADAGRTGSRCWRRCRRGADVPGAAA